ncbi:hypothetical protein RCL1_003068 [Eukaryota sp. TZLM3-RCL]
MDSSKKFIESVVVQLFISLQDSVHAKANDLPAIKRAIMDISKTHPVSTISTALSHLVKPHLPIPAKGTIFDILAAAVDNSNLQRSLTDEVATVVISESISQKESIPDYQNRASNVIAAVSKHFPNSTYAAILATWQSGSLPHPFLLQCVAEFALQNASFIVPNLNEIASRLVNASGLARVPAFRLVFSKAVSSICEAIQHYNADAKDQSSSSSSNALSLSPLFDTVVGWLQVKDVAVKLALVSTLGHLSMVIPSDFLRPRAPKLLQTILGFIKKEKSVDIKLPMCRALSDLLSAITSQSIDFDAPTLDDLLSTIHNLGGISQTSLNDDSAPSAVHLRLWAECIRSLDFLLTGSLTGSRTMEYLLNAIGLLNSNPTNLATAFLFVKQLISTHPNKFADRKDSIIATCRSTCSTNSVFVKKSLVEMTATLARQSMMNAAGASDLINFVVSCSALSTETSQGKSLVRMAEDVLNLIVTTIPDIHVILWPQFLEQLKPLSHFHASSVICKCLSQLFKSLPEESKVSVSFDEYRDIPKPDWMLAHSFLYLHKPNSSSSVKAVISWLKIVPIVFALTNEVTQAIEEGITLISNLEFNTSTYESNLLLFFAKVILSCSDSLQESIAAVLKSAFIVHEDSELKRAILRYIGVIASTTKRKDFVSENISFLLSSTGYEDEKQRQGLASAFGLVSENYLDKILDAIGAVMTGGPGSLPINSQLPRKKKPAKPEEITSALLLCLGSICKHASIVLLASRLETYVLPHVKPYLNVKTKLNPLVREGALACVSLLARALNPVNIPEDYDPKSNKFLLKSRDELINLALDHSNLLDLPDHFTSALRIKALSAFSALVLLPPAIPPQLVTHSLTILLRLTALTSESKKEVFERLEQCCVSLIESNLSIERLLLICNSLFPWITDGPVHAKGAALSCLRAIFDRVIELFSQSNAKNSNEVFPIGTILGPLVPCGFNEDPFIRSVALDCIELVLFALNLYTDGVSNSGFIGSDNFKKLTNTKLLLKDDVTQAACTCLGSSTGILLSTCEQVLDLVSVMGKVLTSCSPSVGSYSAAFLSALIASKGSEIQDQVVGIFSILVSSLSIVKCQATTFVNDGSLAGALLDPTILIAEEHLTIVMDHLLSSFTTSKLPSSLDPSISAVLRGVVSKSVGSTVLWRILEALNSSQQYEAPRGSSIQPSGVSSGLTLMLAECLASKVADTVIEGSKVTLEEGENALVSSDDRAVGLWTAILCTLLLRIGCVKSLINSETHKQAVRALVNFLSLKSNNSLNNTINNTGALNLLNSEATIPHGITNIAFSVVRTRPDMLVPIYKFLCKFFSSSYAGQRLVSTTLVAEFIRHFSKPSKFMLALVNSILSRTTDDDQIVRLMAIKGLGNVAASGKKQINKYCGTVLNCLLPTMADQSDDVAVESLNALRSTIDQADADKIDSMIVTISLHLKPLLSRPSIHLRSAVLSLLASLCNIDSDASVQGLAEQANHYIPFLFIFSFDDSEEVRTVALAALKAFSKKLGFVGLFELVDKKDDVCSFSDYLSFMKAVSFYLHESLPSHVAPFILGSLLCTKSDIDVVRANAAVVAATLVQPISEANRKKLSVDHAPLEILSMLKDSCSNVRTSAALALSTFA